MLRTQSGRFDPSEKRFALLLGELDHRIRNLLIMIETIVRQAQSTSVEGYRTKLLARMTGLYGFCQLTSLSGRTVNLADLIEQTMRPYCTSSAEVLAAGADLELEPSLALALHLVFDELAANAKTYGALGSPSGRVRIEWKIRDFPDAPRKLAIVWSEHGGPKVKSPQNRGLDSRLIKTALEAYGGVRLDFNSTGLTCFMLIEPLRAD